MRIKNVTMIDHLSGWNIKDISFQPLTLLVGASGVGKTKILKALLEITNIAKGRSYNGVEWSISFEHQSSFYLWSGAFDIIGEDDISFFDKGERNYTINRELLICDNTTIIDRTSDKLLYHGQETLRLDAAQSAIALLKEEVDIKPISEAFSQVFKLENENFGIRISAALSKKREQLKDTNAIHGSRILSPVEKLFVLHKNGLPQFSQIVEIFKDIFPLVESVDFSKEQFFDGTAVPILRIKEKGVKSWIMQSEISSGMYRTLSQITILALAQDGDVILIDEFENGLGVNCIDRLADQMINPEKDIQVIITSHHPYIINNIPFSRWKIVTREHSSVKVLSASDLNIGTHSKHDAFMQLIQTNAFKTGQQ